MRQINLVFEPFSMKFKSLGRLGTEIKIAEISSDQVLWLY